MPKVQRVSEVTLYEVYIDLWGMTSPWINTIQDRLLDFSNPSQDETCESYSNPACMAVRFRTASKDRAERFKGLFARLANLAKRTTKDEADDTAYWWR